MRKQFELKSRSGNLIRGEVDIPKGCKSIIIACHGFTSSLNDTFRKYCEKQIHNMDIGIVRFDFSGHGISNGRFEDITISKGVDDLNAVVTDVLSKYDGMKIMIYGRSFGGNVAYIYTCTIGKEKLKKSLVGLLLNAPSFNFKEIQDNLLSTKQIEEWKRIGYLKRSNGRRLNYTFYEDLQTIPKYEIATELHIDAMIIHGTEDLAVPIQQSEKLKSMLENVHLHAVEGAGHSFKNKRHLQESVEKTIDFIKSKLM